MSKTQKIYQAITRNKKGLTTAQIRQRFGVTNVSAFINDLRRTGHTVLSINQRWVA